MNRATKHLLVLLFLLKGSVMFSQYQKDTIFLKFEENKGKKPYYRGIKFYNKEEKGMVFNLISTGSLLFSNKKKADTLDIMCLKDYPIVTMKEVEEKVKEFRYKTYRKSPPNKADKAYQFYNKNDIFETYLIEIIEGDKFVVYPVTWRNQNIVD